VPGAVHTARRRALILLLTVLLSMVALTHSTSDDARAPTPEVEAALAAIREGFAAAYARGDVPTLLSFYDPEYVDASVGVAVRGKEEMRAAFESTFSRYDGSLDIRPEEVLANGSWALERGTFSIHSTDRASGAHTVSHRRYLEVLVRRDDGRWYIFRDLDNELPGA